MRLFALLAILVLVAQVAAQPAQQYECVWTDTPIVIDGKADDAGWGKKSFPFGQAGRIQLAWDRSYLYFTASHVNYLLLKPAADKTGEYEIQVKEDGTATCHFFPLS